MTEKAKTKKGFSVVEITLIIFTALAGYLLYTSNNAPDNVYAVMGEGEVIDARISKGDSAVEALVYFNTLIKIYAHKGVIVYDKDAMVTYPKSMEAVLPSKDALFAMAKKAGFPVTDNTYLSAQAEIDKQTKMILDTLYKN